MNEQDKKRAYKRAYRQANRERVNAVWRAWAAKNPDATRAQRKKWRDANPEYQHEWHKTHPGYAREASRRRRERQKTQLGPGCQDKLKAMFIACSWLRAQGIDVHVDHIVPLAAGGLHDISNLQIIPASLNQQKNDKS